ncbi:MAG: signal peptidase I [Gammaproteobacteria bacterium]|nr:signal peptidase I [Gammaproteobacteria bacterium]
MRKFLKNYISLILFFIILVFFRTAVADWNYVPSGSMEPTLFDGDWVLVDKTTYGPSVPIANIRLGKFNSPERGDIITFVPPHTDVLYVKRVVGIPGDQIAFSDRDIIINDKKLSYNQLMIEASKEIGQELLGHAGHLIKYSSNARLPESNGFFIVPEDRYFVLGDHRSNSADSRFWGFVLGDQIMGKVTHVAFSISSKRPLLERIAIPL